MKHFNILPCLKRCVPVILLVALMLPATLWAAEGDLSVAIVTINAGKVPKKVMQKIEADLKDYFKGREGYSLMKDRDLLRRFKKAKVNLKRLSTKAQMIDAAKKLKVDVLVVANLKYKGEPGFDIDLWFVDGRHEKLHRRLNTECPQCSPNVLMDNFNQLSGALFEGPYSLYLDTDPSGAKVLENEKELGTTPLDAKFSAGNHTIRIEKDGYETLEIEFPMPGDRPLEATIPLSKKEAPAVVAAPVPVEPPAATPEVKPEVKPKAPEPEPVVAAVPPAEPTPKVQAEESYDDFEVTDKPAGPPRKAGEPSEMTKWGGRMLWIGGLTAGAGAILTLSSVYYDNQADDRGLLPTDKQDAEDAARSYAVLSYVTYGIAGAAIITGVILLLTDDSDNDDGVQFVVAPAVSDDGLGAAATVNW